MTFGLLFLLLFSSKVIIYDNFRLPLHHENVSMDISYSNQDLEDLILRGKSSDKLYMKLSRNKRFMCDLAKVMESLRGVPNVSQLHDKGSLHYEPLKYGLSGFSSVRIGYNSKYRLLFTEKENGISIELININEHYGDK